MPNAVVEHILSYIILHADDAHNALTTRTHISKYDGKLCKGSLDNRCADLT